MSTYHLTTEQKTQLEFQHSIARDIRESDRIKAILLRDEGWRLSRIAQALRIHKSTITCHINDYIENEKLLPENGGSESLLDKEQTQQLIEHLTHQVYSQQKEIIFVSVSKFANVLCAMQN